MSAIQRLTGVTTRPCTARAVRALRLGTAVIDFGSTRTRTGWQRGSGQKNWRGPNLQLAEYTRQYPGTTLTRSCVFAPVSAHTSAAASDFPSVILMDTISHPLTPHGRHLWLGKCMLACRCRE